MAIPKELTNLVHHLLPRKNRAIETSTQRQKRDRLNLKNRRMNPKAKMTRCKKISNKFKRNRSKTPFRKAISPRSAHKRMCFSSSWRKWAIPKFWRLNSKIFKSWMMLWMKMILSQTIKWMILKMTKQMPQVAFIRSFSRITHKTRINYKILRNRIKAKVNSSMKSLLRPKNRSKMNHNPRKNQTKVKFQGSKRKY